jgi:hypothetical protein
VTYAATAIIVLVASPGDTAEERAAIQLALSRWNVDRGEREGIVVIPWLYEQHAVPALGSYAQSIINSQAVDRADVIVAFFDSRLGTETPAAVSGTAEEIQRAHQAGKPVHVYFSEEPINRSLVDVKQLAALETFRKSLGSEGLLGSYSGSLDLANQVLSAIDYDVSAKNWSTPSHRQSEIGARINAHHDHQREVTGIDSRGKTRYRTIANHLVIRNDGYSTAEGILVRAAGIGGDVKFEQPSPFDLTPGSEIAFPMTGLGGTENVRIVMTWTEGGQAKDFSQTVRLG